MNVKSPCIDHCKLNEKKNQCVGCHRTVEEITEWNSYSNDKKIKILKLLKLRKSGIVCFLFMIFFYNTVLSFDNWIGNWIALDQWQSEFEIVIKKDGTATTDYGSGDQGNWLIVDGNLLINGVLEKKIIYSVALWVINAYQKIKWKLYQWIIKIT